MAVRYNKRLERNNALSSNEDAVTTTPNDHSLNALRETTSQLHSGVLPSRARQETISSNYKITLDDSAPASSTLTSPRKGKKRPSSRQGKTNTIYSFFSQAALPSTRVSDAKSTSEALISEEHDDAIEDDDSDYDMVQERKRRKVGHGRSSGAVRASAALQKEEVVGRESSVSVGRRFISGSTALGDKSYPLIPDLDSHKHTPWMESYKPQGLEELAVHKKKVSEVRSWLNHVFGGKERKRLLVLRGPSGSGKTATIDVLSKILQFEVVEWRNPIGEDYTSANYVSTSNQFRDFLERGDRYGRLDLDLDRPQLSSSTGSIQDSSDSAERNKILLVEELPYTFSHSNRGLATLQSNIMCHITSDLPTSSVPLRGNGTAHAAAVPLVILVSETANNLSSGSDSITAHRLLGPDVLHHLRTTVIDFNRIAPTILAKALDLLVRKEARDTGRRRTPSTALIKRLSENGDIRNAISSLEFLCLRGDSDSIAPRNNKKKAQSKSSMTKMESHILEHVVRRTSTLDLFHAVGKVVYNKRLKPSEFDHPVGPVVNPPQHLQHQARCTLSEVDVDQLADETGTDATTFVAALHENYVLSCGGEDFLGTLENSIGMLSDADLLSRKPHSFDSSRFSMRTSNQNHSSIDFVRQDDMVFNLAVRGLLFALPSPVRRSALANSSSHERERDAYKMFYPASMRLWKRAEDIAGLIDRWSESSWDLKTRNVTSMNQAPASLYTAQSMARGAVHDRDSEGLLSPGGSVRMSIGGCSNRSELILDVLPFAVNIDCVSHNPSPYLSRLRQIVQFREAERLQTPVDDDSLSWNPLARKEFPWSTQTKDDGLFPKIFPDSLQRGAEKLVLSDDDIED